MVKRTHNLQSRKFKVRRTDPYLDRRSGDDRRQIYSFIYFDAGGSERRGYVERRDILERRFGYIRIGPWTSVGPLS
ncbi:MAG: hypothetical protein ACN4GW_09665 [Desulforhopalus sp.]